MNERTLKVLEFHKVIHLLMAETATSVGRELASEIVPSTSIEKVQLLQDETDEALHVLRLNKNVPFSHMEDITESLKRSEIGSTLSTEECLHVAQTIYTGRNIKTFLEGLEEDLPLLKEIVVQITPLRHLEKEIKLKIDDHGEVVDDASSALKSIRQAIKSYETRIRERLQQLTRTKSNMLTDTIVTIRNNRYCLPVKHEYRSAIGGIVHDQSSSGQTLFMEPKAIIELNNKLQQTVVKEKQEIELILQQLTDKIATHKEELAVNLQVV